MIVGCPAGRLKTQLMTGSMTDLRPPADPLLAIREPIMRGDHAAAADWLDHYLQTTPHDARALGLLGRCRRELRQFDAAERALLGSLALVPDLLASQRECALLARDRGDIANAEAQIKALLQRLPADPSLWWELTLLQSTESPETALESLTALRRLRPDDVEPALLDAQLNLRLGQHAKAEAAAQWVLARQPQRVEALEIAYWSMVNLGIESPDRLAISRSLAQLAPNGERLMALSHDLYAAGDFSAGHRAIEHAREHAPDFLAARWASFQLPSAPAPLTEDDAGAFRQQWRDALDEWAQLDFSEPALAAQVWGCVGQSTAFYRHYLDDAVADQKRYGELVHRMMRTLDSGIEPRAMRATRRRIGFCGAYFRAHTVTRLFGPLIEALAREDFEIEVFALAGLSDGWHERLSAAARVHAEPRSAPEWRGLIAERQLDVLLYPEIGMHPLTQGLAAIRLAPVQASLWGHPVSSGMPSIDYVLSPDAMEPADGQDFYTEKLVRLPGLGHGLQASDLPTPEQVILDEPDAARIDLLCAQTVYKLLPEQDLLFGRILARLPNVRLHLLGDDRAPVRDWLRQRITPILRACGADPERQLRIHGFFPLPQFLGLAKAACLNLDSVGWSGGMSALDLLGQGLPTLTIEGHSMRTRQTAALLQRLEVPELIAIDADDYVERAVALVSDSAMLASLRERIVHNRQRLFADAQTVEAMTQFLRTVTSTPITAA